VIADEQLDALDPEQSSWMTWRAPGASSVNGVFTTAAKSLNKR
jgi:hypothetical protein